MSFPQPSLPTSSTSLRPDTQIYHTLHRRYLSTPSVRSFLLDSTPAPVPAPSLIHQSFSYACLYHNHKPSSPTSRLPQPVLEEGNLMLLTGIHDGIAIGYLFSRNNLTSHYGLAETRESIGRTGLSMTVKTRRFATDLRRSRGKEYVEFGWMNDDSLIVACRRLEPGAGSGGLVLTAELLFFDRPDWMFEQWAWGKAGFEGRRLLRMMCCTEKVDSTFSLFGGTGGGGGMLDTQCGNQWRFQQQNWNQNPPQNQWQMVPMHDGEQRDLEMQQVGSAGSWSNFVQKCFGLRQSGSFSVRWWKEKDVMLDLDTFAMGNDDQGQPGPKINDLEFFLEKKRPVKYDFVCGSDLETGTLIGLFLAQREQESRLCRSDVRYITGDEEVSEKAHIEQVPWKSSMSMQSMTDEFLGTEEKIGYYDTNMGNHYVEELKDSPISSTRSAPHMSEDVILTDISNEVPAACDATKAVGQCEAQVPVMPVRHDRAGSSYSNSDLNADGQLSAESIDISAIKYGTYNGRQCRSLTLETQDNTYTVLLNAKDRPVCPLCDKDFPKPGNVKRHIQTVHEKRKDFRCDECGKEFGHKTHRDRHVKTHWPEKPYGCQWCEATFRTNVQLERHISSVHKAQDGDSKRASEYTCQHCGIAFAQKSNLNRHVQSIHEHVRFKCSYCPKTFGQPFDMKRHVQNKHKGMTLALNSLVGV